MSHDLFQTVLLLALVGIQARRAFASERVRSVLAGHFTPAPGLNGPARHQRVGQDPRVNFVAQQVAEEAKRRLRLIRDWPDDAG